MIIAQITDFHIYAPGYEPRDGFDTAERLALTVKILNALDPAPDLILATGDLVDRGSEEEYRHLKEVLAPLRHPLHLIPGNHDERRALRAVFPELAYLEPGSRFMQYVLEKGPIRLIGLDTLEDGYVGGVQCAERLAWLETRLSEAPQTPTLLFMHHPPFLTGIPDFDRMAFEGAESFRRIVEANPQVRRIIAGHTHRVIQTQIGNAIASTAPSTAYTYAMDLRPGQPPRKTGEACGFQIHLWQEETARFVSHTVLLNEPNRL